MNIRWHISRSDTDKFVRSCEATLRNVDTGTKTATDQACREILAASLEQVPRDTNTLASTAFYEVVRRSDTKSYRYEGIIGYAGTVGSGASHDAINPKRGIPASAYALKVHEDTKSVHLNGGKAKYLEDPVRAYANDNFTRVAESHWMRALNGSVSKD